MYYYVKEFVQTIYNIINNNYNNINHIQIKLIIIIQSIDDLLWNKLPEWMTDKQKKVKVNNLLSELRRIQKIENQQYEKLSPRSKEVFMIV